MDRPLRVTLLMTLSRVSSLYTKSKSFKNEQREDNGTVLRSLYVRCTQISHNENLTYREFTLLETQKHSIILTLLYACLSENQDGEH